MDKQITSANIKIPISEKELAIHNTQIENSRQVELFLRDKFTSQELYLWMKEQLFTVYRQSFNMAYDMAKKVEKCCRFEIGNEATSFIQYGYWDNMHQGLCAGEKLHLALHELEKSYLEENRRELELTKSISISLLNPLALLELKTTGKCNINIPEELFDLDYQGHYFRRIKSVSLSIPCIAGPYTTVNCTLRLLKNTIRINTAMNDENYFHNTKDGSWIEDDRFRENNIPVKSIATSSAQRDSGMFELSFRDERYLPFEGAGAISEWKIELTEEPELRQFDYASISDVILQMNYTAREDAGAFKVKAVENIKSFLKKGTELGDQPLTRMFSMRHEFATEWHRFLFPLVAGSEQIMRFKLEESHFPFLAKRRNIDVMQVDVLAKTNRLKVNDLPNVYHLVMTSIAKNAELRTSAEVSLPENDSYGGMQVVTLPQTTSNLVVENIDVFSEITIKVKYELEEHYDSLDTVQNELEDLFVVIYYKLSDKNPDRNL